MTKLLSGKMKTMFDVGDRMMYAGLVLTAISIPYSIALLQAAMFFILIGTILKRSAIGTFKPSPCSLGWPILFVGLLILLTISMSHDSGLTLKKFFSRFMQQALLMYSAIETIRTPRRLYGIMAAILLTMSVTVFDVLIQLPLGRDLFFNAPLIWGRVCGPMRHPNDLATYLVTLLPVVFTLTITRSYWIPLLYGQRCREFMARYGTVFCYTLFVLLVIALGLTISRGAWIAFVLTFLGIALWLKEFRLSGVIAGIIGLFLLVFWSFCLTHRSDLNSTEFDAVKILLNPSSRYKYWETAWGVIKLNPLFGCGFGTYVQTLKSIGNVYGTYPHSSLLHITAELGFLGLAGYLCMFIFFVRESIKGLKALSPHREIYILAGGVLFGLLAWGLHSLMDTPWSSIKLSTLLWLLVGISLALPRLEFDQQKRGG